MSRIELRYSQYAEDVHTELINTGKLKINKGPGEKQKGSNLYRSVTVMTTSACQAFPIFRKIIYPRPTALVIPSPQTYQESSPDPTSSSLCSEIDAYGKVRFNIIKDNASKHHCTSSGRQLRVKNLDSEPDQSFSDQSLTLSADSSPYILNAKTNVIDRGTCTHLLHRHNNYKKKSCCSYRRHKINSSSSDTMSKPKPRTRRSRSRTCRHKSDGRQHRSSSRHHRHHSRKVRSPRHHICCSSSEEREFIPRNNVRHHSSGFKGVSHRPRHCRSDTGTAKSKYNKHCSKHREINFYSRKSSSSLDSEPSIISPNKPGEAATTSICQVLSENIDHGIYQAQSSESGCGCSPSKPCINTKFCEGCNAALHYRELFAAYSEPGICDDCNYKYSMNKTELNSNGLVYSDLPFRYDKRLGKFLEDDNVELNDNETIRDADSRNEPSSDNFLLPNTDKTSRKKSDYECSSASDYYLPNVKLLTYD